MRILYFITISIFSFACNSANNSTDGNTANAIQSGFILSVLGNLKSFFDLALSKSKDVNIVLSGGDAETIYQHLNEDLKSHSMIKKDLVLDGLFVLASI